MYTRVVAKNKGRSLRGVPWVVFRRPYDKEVDVVRTKDRHVVTEKEGKSETNLQ